MKLVTTLSRITPGAWLCRTLAFSCTLAAIMLALPVTTAESSAAALGGAMLVAVAPGTRVVTLVLLGAVGGWIVALVDTPAAPPVWRLIAFASALYLAHSSAALAAVVPLDAALAPEILTRWYARALGIVGVTATGALVTALGVALVAGWSASWVNSVIGVVAVLAVIAVILRLYRR